MKITKDWLEERHANQECIEWFETLERNEIEAFELIDVLMASGDKEKLKWVNWLITLIMSNKQKLDYAIYAAESVLNIFEKKYPYDNRPRKAIEVAKQKLHATVADIVVAADAAYDAACVVAATDAVYDATCVVVVAAAAYATASAAAVAAATAAVAAVYVASATATASAAAAATADAAATASAAAVYVASATATASAAAAATADVAADAAYYIAAAYTLVTDDYDYKLALQKYLRYGISLLKEK